MRLEILDRALLAEVDQRLEEFASSGGRREAPSMFIVLPGLMLRGN